MGHSNIIGDTHNFQKRIIHAGGIGELQGREESRFIRDSRPTC